MNKQLIIGNLGNEPELRYTPQGTPVLSFSLASNTTGGRDRVTGERVKETDWFEINVFGGGAESASKYLHSGDTVYVEGREKLSIWTPERGKNAGVPQISRKINTNNVQFVTLRGNGVQTASSVPAEAAPTAPAGDLNDDDIPF
jgi:single-strand DNA-binding protein